MSHALFVVVLSLLASPAGEPPDVGSVIQIADRMIQASKQDADFWNGADVVNLEALGEWYRALPQQKKNTYDEMRSNVRKARCFDRPVRFVMTTFAAKPSDEGGLVLAGRLKGRVETLEDYYTRDQKDRIAEIKRAIRDKQNRHNHDMIRLEDNTPYKEDRIQRFHEAIREMGQEVQVLRAKFAPEAEKRMVRGESVIFRVVVAKDQAASIDRSRLGELNQVEVIMDVSDFHIRPPLSEFDRPAALGFFEGKTVKVGGVSYRAPAALPGAGGKVESTGQPGG